MKLLVIGGCGHIGSVVFNWLRQHHLEADSVDAEMRGNPAGIQNRPIDYDSLTVADLADYDTVIWLAGHSTVKACLSDPVGAVANNVTGLIHLAEKLTTQTLIYASSGSVYTRDNGSVYDATKRAADELIHVIHRNTHALRFGTVCGASPNIRRDVMINGMVYDAVTKGSVYVQNAQAKRPILGMNDLTRAIGHIIRGEVKPGIHDLCSFNAMIGQIGHQVAGEVGAFMREDRGDGTYNFVMDCAPWFRPQETTASIVASLMHAHGAQWKKEKVAA